MSDIYILRGTTGGHDSYRTWDVRAYTDTAEADRAMLAINAWCTIHGWQDMLPSDGWLACAQNDDDYVEKRPMSCPLDPAFASKVDQLSVTAYLVVTVPLVKRLHPEPGDTIADDEV